MTKIDIRSAASDYWTTDYPTTGATKVSTAAAPQHQAMTLAAVRQDDARVPPRGRPL